MQWAKYLYTKCHKLSFRAFFYFAVPTTILAYGFYISVPHIPNTYAVWGTSILEQLKTVLYVMFAIKLFEHYKATKVLAYKLFLFATIAWLPGQVIQSITPITDNTPYIYSNSADLFLFVAIAIVIAGVLAFGLFGLTKREKTQILVHAITFGSCVAFVATIFVTNVWLDNRADLISDHVGDFFSLTLDLVLISVCLSLALYRRKDPVVTFICIGLFFQAGADLLYVASQFQTLDSSRPFQRLLIWTALICWVSSSLVKNPLPKHGGSVKSEVVLAIGSYMAIAMVIALAFFQAGSIGDVPEIVIYSFLLTFVTILVTQIIGFMDNKQLVVNQQQSIEEITKSEEKYQELATHDTLTDLVNRSYFIECLENELDEIEDDQSLAVMFIDLDRFKEINDTFGHESGDLVIKTIAHRIEGVVANQGLICRLGGDEFAILVPPPAQRDVTFDIAMKTLQEVIKPIDVFGNEMYLTCSIGIAMSDNDENSEPQGLLRNADAAMYRAKELGRNRIEYSQGALKPARNMTVWSLSDLHKAVAQGEIEIFFQPIVDLETNTTVSFEALARWNHKEFGYISPEEFIPVAEDNGLIIDLGDAVIRQSLSQLEKWNNEFGASNLSVNINLSPRQLNHPNFMSDLMSYCAKYNVSPTKIIFEMTESALLGDVRGVMTILNELKTQGFRVLIDDFGTGYSSLAYLKKFPVSGFKIDKSFIQGYGHEENDTAIVNSLVGLGSTMGIMVVAEGVQSNEVRDALKDLGCNLVQGYLYSEALTAEEVPHSMIKGTTLKSVESA